MTVLQTVVANSGALQQLNENFRSASPAALYGINPSGTSGLTLAYLGGEYNGVSVADGNVTLTASVLNYIVAHRTTGVVSVSTSITNWNNTATYMRLYQFTPGASSFDANAAGADKRQCYASLLLGTVAPLSFSGGAGMNLNGSGVFAIQSLSTQQSKSAAYTLVLLDAGKHLFHPSADVTARIFTIPANASVAYPVGTFVDFINQDSAGAITIAITTDTMRLAGAGTTGNRTLAANGQARALKVATTEWLIWGTNLT